MFVDCTGFGLDRLNCNFLHNTKYTVSSYSKTCHNRNLIAKKNSFTAFKQNTDIIELYHWKTISLQTVSNRYYPSILDNIFMLIFK